MMWSHAPVWHCDDCAVVAIVHVVRAVAHDESLKPAPRHIALQMLSGTGRNGHVQGEVLEELQHNYPLDLLMALSDAAIGAMQVIMVSSTL